jgi:3-hydroxyisobutyrate dehydrogenase-like beta-hydroxyacid dehydrogenase
MKHRFGMIGTGNMGSALAKVLPADKTVLSNRTMEKAEALAAALGCSAACAETVAKELVKMGF